MATQRGRIQITGFDPDEVLERESLTDWADATETGEAVSRRERAFRRFVRNRTALIGLAVVALLTFLTVFARPITIAGVTVQPFSLAPYEPFTRVSFQGADAGVYEAPSVEHPMGTDRDGRDIFSRVLFGGRFSISIGFLVVFVSAAFGTIYGAVAGYYGKWVDEVLMRIVDVIFAFPGLVLALILVAMFRGTISTYWVLLLAFVLPGWASYARLIRGEVLKVKESEYVLAAKALGARNRSVILKHIVPNSIAPVIVQASLAVGTTVIGVAALGFLGLGFTTQPEWGSMLDGARETVVPGPGGTPEWWATFFPGLAIFAFVMAMNMIGDGINDALDAQEVSTVQGGGGG
jgi:peptide/nickel transport system permease protein